MTFVIRRNNNQWLYFVTWRCTSMFIIIMFYRDIVLVARKINVV